MAKLSIKTFSDSNEARARYLQELDQTTERIRSRYITSSPGQAMTYEAKYLEALKGDGPFLQAEAEALGVTVADVAGSVIGARKRWESIGASIEAARLKAKRDIKQAGSAAEMSRIVVGFSFPNNT